MTKYAPLVRVFLTFVCAGLAAVIGVVDDQTVRIVAGALIAGFGAIGIVPPHIPTRTSVDPGVEPVNVIHQEDGYVNGGALVAILLVALLLIILVPVAHLSAFWLLIVVLLVVLVFVA